MEKTMDVFGPDIEDVFATAEHVRNEFVLRIKGRVRARPEGTVNPELSTGEIEILGKELEILNRADTPPFQIDDEDTSEELRLRYRYVDLRRPEMQERIILRRYRCRRSGTAACPRGSGFPAPWVSPPRES